MVKGEFMTLSEAAKSIPGRPHLSTLHRWATRGVGGIHLATMRVGRKRLTTREAVDEFLEALNESDDHRLERAGC